MSEGAQIDEKKDKLMRINKQLDMNIRLLDSIINNQFQHSEKLDALLRGQPSPSANQASWIESELLPWLKKMESSGDTSFSVYSQGIACGFSYTIKFIEQSKEKWK